MTLKLEASTCDLAALVVAGFFHCSEFASGGNKGNELLSSSPGMHSHAQHGNERKPSGALAPKAAWISEMNWRTTDATEAGSFNMRFDQGIKRLSRLIFRD
ncbi:hypothetical protein [Vibrio aerogenes]|uniref:hypothetical protein n=1 Tax=Vibrio aerogenes TaxID=92172 RepID=UPI001114AB69|nr:hypothetical protein [Vibrio aerogenes]